MFCSAVVKHCQILTGFVFNSDYVDSIVFVPFRHACLSHLIVRIGEANIYATTLPFYAVNGGKVKQWMCFFLFFKEEPHGKVQALPSMICHDSRSLYIVIMPNLTFRGIPNQNVFFPSPKPLQQKL